MSDCNRRRKCRIVIAARRRHYDSKRWAHTHRDGGEFGGKAPAVNEITQVGVEQQRPTRLQAHAVSRGVSLSN